MRLSHTFAHLFHPRRSNNHRPRVLHSGAYVWYAALILLAGLGLKMGSRMPASNGNVLGFASSITARQVIEQTNQRRAEQGLAPLTINAQLSQAASAKASDMFDKQYWAHVSPQGVEPWSFIKASGYRYQAAGENLARDFDATGTMVQAWMDSPTHRANIVNSRYTEIGVAVVDGTLQGVETTLVVQLFGRPSSTVAQTLPAQTVELTTEPTLVVEVVPATPLEQPPSEASVPTEAIPVAQPATLTTSPAVLATALFNQGRLTRPPLFSPLQLSKIFFLSIIMMIILTLAYDSLVIGNRQTMRLVGHNLGHILFLTAVAFLVILFKGGLVH